MQNQSFVRNPKEFKKYEEERRKAPPPPRETDIVLDQLGNFLSAKEIKKKMM